MIGVRERIIVSRAVGNRAQKGNLRQVKLVRRLVKISLACGRYAVIAVHKIHIVEIEFKELVLAVLLLKVPGNKDLLDLSLPGSAVVEEYSSGKLHRDRTAALGDLPVHREFLRRADDRFIIHAAVLVEILILNADHCLSEKIRDLSRCQIIGILLGVRLGDQISFRIIDLSGLRGHEGLLCGFTDKGVSFLLHRSHFAVITAKIENAQDCQNAYEHKQ